MVEAANEDDRVMGLAVRYLRKRADMTLQQAADAFGVESGQAFSKYEQGKVRSITQTMVKRRLAEAVKSNVPELEAIAAQLAGKSPFTAFRDAEARERHGVAEDGPARVASETVVPFVNPYELPIRDPVQASAWLAIDDMAQVEQEKFPLARDPRFPRADQWLAPVIGPSVDLMRIFDGDLAHVVSAADIGYAPRTGDIVEVERVRRGGGLRELTIKQVEVTPDGVLLWPRSTDPRFQQPLGLTDGADDVDEVRIRGLVVTTVRRL